MVGGSSLVPRTRWFALLETLGILVFIVFLASILAPRIFSVLADARVIGLVESGNAAKQALIGYFRDNGRLPDGGNPGEELVAAGFLEAPPTSGIRVGESIRFVGGSGASSTSVPGRAAFCYDLDGQGEIDVGTGHTVFEFQLTSVGIADAWELSHIIDGAGLSQPDRLTADMRGRVTYAEPVGGVVSTMYFYLTHK